MTLSVLRPIAFCCSVVSRTDESSAVPREVAALSGVLAATEVWPVAVAGSRGWMRVYQKIAPTTIAIAPTRAAAAAPQDLRLIDRGEKPLVGDWATGELREAMNSPF